VLVLNIHAVAANEVNMHIGLPTQPVVLILDIQ